MGLIQIIADSGINDDGKQQFHFSQTNQLKTEFK